MKAAASGECRVLLCVGMPFTRSPPLPFHARQPKSNCIRPPDFPPAPHILYRISTVGPTQLGGTRDKRTCLGVLH